MSHLVFISRADPTDLSLAKFSCESDEQVAHRFLDARAGDVDKALLLLRECGAVKRRHRVEELRHLSPEEVLGADPRVLGHFYPHGSLGFDKQHRPLLFEHTGGIDIHAVLHMTSLERLLDLHIWTMEVKMDAMLTEAFNAADSSMNSVKVVAVTDLNKLTLAHCSPKLVDHVKGIIAVDNVCYPEALGNMFVVNAPKLALGAYRALRGFLDPRTQRKIEMIGSSDKVRQRLLEIVDETQLPASLGGSGPEPYAKKPHTGYVSIDRRGHFAYSLSVASGQRLRVDSYIRDSPMEVRVVREEGEAASEEVYRETVPALPHGEATRKCFTLDPLKISGKVTVTWSNLERWHSRHLVYSVEVE